MINFFIETDGIDLQEKIIDTWITMVIKSEGKKLGEINFIICDDAYLLDINKKYLNHDTFTDIISFDTSMGNEINGDIFISAERVKENSGIYNVSFDQELRRVLVHGILHFCGHKDKTKGEKEAMRLKEDEKLSLFHVEQ